MNLVLGGDLSELLKKETKISEERAVGLFRDIVNAFRACNELNVIHRDIKPANIMLKLDGSAYVNDFGIATISKLKLIFLIIFNYFYNY